MKLSVIVPAHNEEGHINACLERLFAQTIKPYEVIVVDNNCTDSTINLAQKWPTKIVSELNQGIGYAASAGYDAARGDIIVRCDADSRVASNWLERIQNIMSDTSTIAVTGPAYFYDAPRAVDVTARRLYIDAYFMTVGAALGQTPLFGSNCAFRRSVWQKISNDVHRSNNDIHDDIDLSYHISPLGHIKFDADLVVGISARPFKSVRGMRKRYARGYKSIVMHWPEQAPWRT